MRSDAITVSAASADAPLPNLFSRVFTLQLLLAEILYTMLAEICKYKQSLTRAFRTCEKREQGRRTDRNTDSGSNKLNRSLLLRRSSNLQSRKVSYGKWLEVMSAYMPEFEGLWSEYGARLLGGHAFPPIPPGGTPSVSGTQVAYMAWLGRFQVSSSTQHFTSPSLTHHSQYFPTSPLTTLFLSLNDLSPLNCAVFGGSLGGNLSRTRRIACSKSLEAIQPLPSTSR